MSEPQATVVASNELFSSGMKLTVILRDDSPMIHCGDSPAYRSVQFDLTPEQVAAIAPRKTGSTGRQIEYESISKAFIEPNPSHQPHDIPNQEKP